MTKSSIHFQGIKSNSEGHNKRLNQKLDYVFDNLSHLNSNVFFSKNIKQGVTNATHIDFLKTIVKEKTGRSAQDKSHMLQEGVFNFNKNHSDQDIQVAISSFCKQMNLLPIRLSIHRDEGHELIDGTRNINLHAHLTVEWIDRNTGKSHKWTKIEASKCQTILADCLGMERGKESNKKHLNSLDYKLKIKTEELLELEKKILENLEIEKKQILNPDHTVLQNLQHQKNKQLVELIQQASKKELLNFPKIFREADPELWINTLALLKKITSEKSRLEELNVRAVDLKRLEEQISKQRNAVSKAETEAKKLKVAAETPKPTQRKTGPKR